MSKRISFLILFVFSSSIFYASDTKVTFKKELEETSKNVLQKTSLQPSKKHPKRESCFLEDMHPCKGVCSCGCYIDKKNDFQRVCDIGLQPLGSIRPQDEPIYFGCNCTDKISFKRLINQDLGTTLNSLVKGIFCLHNLYIVGTWRVIPTVDDNGHEKLEASCYQKLACDYINIRNAYAVSNQGTTKKLVILNPCEKIME